MRTVIISTTAVLVVLLGASSAFCCSCIGPGPPCQSYGNTPAVFVGTALEVKQTSEKLIAGEDRQFPQRAFIFRIDEPFRGVNTAQVEVRTGMGGGDCGYNFKLGERYLVYASFNATNGFYGTNICTRTRPVSDAGEDLDYIRGLKDREPGATLSGEIRRYRRNPETEGTQQVGPLANIEISVKGEGRSYTTRTDERGRYQLTKLEPGQYVVRAELPDGLSTYDSERKTKLNDRGCSVVSFQVMDNGRISGRVLDADGQPVPKMMLNLIPASQADSTRPNSMIAEADVEGRYELKFVPPGNYLLGIRLNGLNGPESVATAYPRSYYPSVLKATEAVVITIGEGTVLKDVNLRLPPRLVKRVISGKVIFPDGSPAVKASVAHAETTYAARGVAYGVSADEQGNFSFDGYEGISYYVRAHVNDSNGKQRHAEPVAVPTRGADTNLVLVISEPNGTCERCRNLLYGTNRSKP
jgi:Carboxypeptidase regulatory-like domain